MEGAHGIEQVFKDSEMMFCAECGSKMTRHAEGWWPRCCNGRGYWYKEQPLGRDHWWKVLTKDGYSFYPTALWDASQKPVPPIME